MSPPPLTLNSLSACEQPTQTPCLLAHTTHRMDVESWDDLALAAAETLHKGMQVHVMGRLKVDQYPHRDHPGVTMTKPKVRGAACWG